MNDSSSETKSLMQKLTSPWVLGIISVAMIGGAGTLSALVAVGILP